MTKRFVKTKMVMVCLLALQLASAAAAFAAFAPGRPHGARAAVDGTENKIAGFETFAGRGSTIWPAFGFEMKAADFTLTDQFGNETAIKFPSDKPVVLVFGDREGSKQVENWVRPVYAEFTDRIYIFGIAELSAVPRLARPAVRRIIRSKSKNPIMLDWTGSVARSYGCENGKANVFVVDRDGKVAAVRRGAADAGGLKDLYDRINGSLKKD